jgi:hypothetical protein
MADDGASSGLAEASDGGTGGNANDASEEDAHPSPDASDAADAADAPDGATCPALGMPGQTFNQVLVSLCMGPLGTSYGVYSGTVACDGLLAIAEGHGADGEDLYLFDPTTGNLVEELSGNDGRLTCLGSATGTDRTKDLAYQPCGVDLVEPYSSGFGLQVACLDAGPDGSSVVDARADSSTTLDASSNDP